MKWISLWVLPILFSFHVVTGNIRFTVTTEKTSLVPGEQIIITATVVSNKELKSMTPPPLPKSEFYRLLRTNTNQHQTSSVQVVNGKMTQTREMTYLFYYYLSMLKEGSFTFPSLTFTHSGKSYSSKPFPMTVGKTPAKTKDIRVSIRMNKKRLYVGEQCIATIEIRKKPQAPVNVTSAGFSNIVNGVEKSFGKSFSINRLFKDKVGQSQRAIKGETYQIYSLSFSVTPIKPGKYSIPPIPFEYVELHQVQRRNQDFFNDFFGGSFFGRSIQQVPKSILSSRLSIDVIPLPKEPADFSGAVGTFSLKAEVSENKVPAGDAVTLNILLRGSTRPGNLTDIKLPELPDFEIFTPEKHTYVDTTAKGISTRKKFKYLLIPREEGEKTISPITWTYFDPGKAAYKTLATEPIPITVGKGKKGAKRQTRYLTQEDIREIGHDIRYIKTPVQIKHQSTKPYKNSLLFALFPIPFLIALFALLYRIQATILRKDPALRLRKRALSNASRALVTLKKEFSDTMAPSGAVSRIAEIIETYISHRFGFAAIGKTLDELKDELARLQVDQSVTDILVPFLTTLDSYRFGGTTPNKNSVNDLLEKTPALIEKLERKEKKV